MACWEMTTVKSKIRMKDADDLRKVLQALKMRFVDDGESIDVGRITFNLRREEVIYRSEDEGTVNKIRQAYAVFKVKKVAKSKRWSVKITGNKKLQVVKF